MRNLFGGPIGGLLVISLCAPALLAQDAGQGGGRGGRGGRGGGGRGQAQMRCTNDWQIQGCEQRPAPATLDPHDLSGVWTRSRGPGSLGNTIQMTPDGKARFDANKPSFG